MCSNTTGYWYYQERICWLYRESWSEKCYESCYKKNLRSFFSSDLTSNGFFIFHTVHSWYLQVLLNFFTTELFHIVVIQRVFSILFCFSFLCLLILNIFKLFYDVWSRSKNKCYLVPFTLLSYYVLSHETSKRKNYGNMLTTVLYSSTPKWWYFFTDNRYKFI